MIDVREETETCHRILTGQPYDDGLVDQLLRTGEPLASLDEDWAMVAKARIQQMRLLALERLCEDATADRNFGRATEAGLAAVSEDPLRESAHRALIHLYMAQGNRSQALRQYTTYRRLMRAELALPPTRAMRELISGVRAT
jgi:DNA-binding SARP family transcriptional activator